MKAQTYIPAVLVAGALVFLAVMLMLKPITPVMGSTANLTQYLGNATTSATVSVTTTTRVLATTTNTLGNGTSYTRLYATICNPTSNIVWLRLDGDKPVNATNAGGIPIGAAAGFNACYEIKDQGYNGSVQASSTSQAAVNVVVTDYVY